MEKVLSKPWYWFDNFERSASEQKLQKNYWCWAQTYFKLWWQPFKAASYFLYELVFQCTNWRSSVEYCHRKNERIRCWISVSHNGGHEKKTSYHKRISWIEEYQLFGKKTMIISTDKFLDNKCFNLKKRNIKH